MPDPAMPPVDRIGLILVHGIGEQRRFQHLDSQLRDLIRALQGLPVVQQVTVDIAGSGAAAFHAEQDTWTAGRDPSVTVVVHHTLNGAPQESRLLVHEVWWADVNEPYSLAKQFRFWLWGLAVWAHPGKPRSGLGTADRVAPPLVPGQSQLFDRVRLFLTGIFFVLVGFSIGALTFLANRLLNWQTPDLLRVMANYISAVKLYNQRRRFGSGLFWSKEEFLDAVDEPPRVSVRRRMIRGIADVACNGYDRWYVLAHSQGSVVAFNGLMETAYAWPGYLDEQRWNRLCCLGLAGPSRPGMVPPTKRIMPRRPGWAKPTDIAYRRRIFGSFRGLLTYGSPLEKFAGLWPALVPISRDPAFASNIPWLNLYDPIDPVSGRLLAFEMQPEKCCPRPENLGYAASWWLLLAHLKYLTGRKPQPHAATATVRWLLTDSTEGFKRNRTGWGLGTWFRPTDPQHKLRTAIAWASWIGAAIVLLLLGAIILPMLLDAAGAALGAIWREAVRLAPWIEAPGDRIAGWFAWIVAFGAWLARQGSTYWGRVVVLACSAFALTAVIGIIARLLIFFPRDLDDTRRLGSAAPPAPPAPDHRDFTLSIEEPD